MLISGGLPGEEIGRASVPGRSQGEFVQVRQAGGNEQEVQDRVEEVRHHLHSVRLPTTPLHPWSEYWLDCSLCSSPAFGPGEASPRLTPTPVPPLAVNLLLPILPLLNGIEERLDFLVLACELVNPLFIYLFKTQSFI